MNTRANPKHTPAVAASTIGRAGEPLCSSGPLAATAPNTASAMPPNASVEGRSPCNKPTSTGTREPSAATEATTLIVPLPSPA